MSDEIMSFGTAFDTLLQPAGDAATVTDAADGTAGFSDAGSALDTANAASDAAPTVSEAANLADAGSPLDQANAATPEPTPAPQTTSIPAQVAQSGGAPAPAPGAQPPAPVQDLSTPAQPASALDKVGQSVKDNPGAAGIIGKMLAGGASGAMTALAMKNRLQAQRDAEERARQDFIRRDQVPALAPGTFTPKSGGIIDTVRGK